MRKQSAQQRVDQWVGGWVNGASEERAAGGERTHAGDDVLIHPYRLVLAPGAPSARAPSTDRAPVGAGAQSV